MSTLDTLPEKQFAQFMTGLLAMFSKSGWLVLLWGLLFLPIGFTIQTVALIKSNAFSRWQSISFLIGVLLVSTPDGFESINQSKSILMAVALVPYGIQIMVSQLE